MFARNNSSNNNSNNFNIQRTIHYVLAQADSVHLSPLDVETIKQVLLTKLMISDAIPFSATGMSNADGSFTSTGRPNNTNRNASKNHIAKKSNNNTNGDHHDEEDDGNMSNSASVVNQSNNEQIALLAARRVTAEAAHNNNSNGNNNNTALDILSSLHPHPQQPPISPEQETQQLCEKVLAKLDAHRKATLRAIAAARLYDTAWANLVPTIRRFDVELPLEDIHSLQGKMTITEHISRCVLAMRALAVWQASAVQLIEAVLLWRSGLNRPFPFALDGQCNILLRVALDAAAIKSSPIPHPLLIGGAGVDLDQVVIPIFLSHLPSLCEFALVSSSQDAVLETNSISAQSLFGFGENAGNNTHNNNNNFGNEAYNNVSTAISSSNASSVANLENSAISTSGEDALVKSLARRWERRVIGMHFASTQDAVAWALAAAEDVVASFASLPGRRGQPQESYMKRVRTAEFTISLEHNTHWQLMRELLTLCAEGKHVPLLNLPGVLFPRGGEDGVSIECPQLLEGLFRTLVTAIESLNAVTEPPPQQETQQQQHDENNENNNQNDDEVDVRYITEENNNTQNNNKSQSPKKRQQQQQNDQHVHYNNSTSNNLPPQPPPRPSSATGSRSSNQVPALYNSNNTNSPPSATSARTPAESPRSSATSGRKQQNEKKTASQKKAGDDDDDFEAESELDQDDDVQKVKKKQTEDTAPSYGSGYGYGGFVL